jgi:phosphonate transport system ATP-binding protein
LRSAFAQRASTLSPGQQQRAAIARVLLQGARVMDILARVSREDRCALVIIINATVSYIALM